MGNKKYGQTREEVETTVGASWFFILTEFRDEFITNIVK